MLLRYITNYSFKLGVSANSISEKKRKETLVENMEYSAQLVHFKNKSPNL